MEEIFLIPFGSVQYGIWKDDIRSVRSLEALHRIPLSPACIAGIMIEGGQTVTLANLPVCIGSGSAREIEQGCILLMEERERLLGFVVGGELRTQSISTGMLFPLPDYLKTPFFDACAVHDGIPIPLIKIAGLHARALKPGYDASVEPPGIAGVRPLDISGMERIRFLSVGGESFAVSAAGMQHTAAKPGPITPLPNTPRYVKGITFFDGSLLPVIDLPQRIKWQGSPPGSSMLVAEIENAAFGLLIDGDGGAVSSGEAVIQPAPLIVQTSWMKHMVVRAGEPIPLIDVAIALSPDSAEDENPIWQRYAPDSAFPEVFFKRDVEVVEFSLLGERHALPRDEVEDVVSFKPCRALPIAPPIVIGVAEHNGEILPVVDLAMMFGRRSLATPAWRMMLVKNGNFRALVVTETVFGGRHLPPETHRTVPVHLPHNLMYGCYPDGKAARIILNIEAISVHFEKSLIKKFLPTLSQEMSMSPTGAIYAFPGENTPGAPQALTTGIPKASEPAEAVARARAEEKSGRHAAAEPALETAPKPSAAHLSLEGVNGIIQGAPEAAHSAMDAVPAEVRSETTVAPEARVTEANVPRPIGPSHGTTVLQPPGRNNDMRKPVSPETPSPWVGMSTPAQIDTSLERLRPENPALEASASAKRAEPVHQSASPSRSPLAATAEVDEGTTATAANSKQPLEPAPGVTSPDAVRLRQKSPAEEQRPTPAVAQVQAYGPKKRGIANGAISAVLITILAFVYFTTGKHTLERPAKASGPAKMERVTELPANTAAIPAQAKTQTESKAEKAAPRKAPGSRVEAQATAEPESKRERTLALTHQTKARPADGAPAPLELVIPKHMPKIEIDEYVVVAGDTLWSISMRFTGSPFNYPHLAGENRIANPDLIFPGQRIRLIK